MQLNLHTYQQCLSTYSIWIEFCIDKLQKDYYRECTNFEIWYNRLKGSRVQIIFFRDYKDYLYILEHSIFAWRIHIHYEFCRICHCPLGCTREEIIKIIIKEIIKIYRNGDIPK
ncbi:hypothetical protein BACCELL_00941 [Bacteroides cellulosilyticus DSM 14838]|uniref:Uncharacterized protein n=1 Tax=Bacteroides cellulosilyticus DSM 14838 TaxID=537012 RepID=E2N9J5_9BACE|nr:hypothetical protein BACCELL_00941 [Bacteroides cellulosilyticus DSM 14838]